MYRARGCDQTQQPCDEAYDRDLRRRAFPAWGVAESTGQIRDEGATPVGQGTAKYALFDRAHAAERRVGCIERDSTSKRERFRTEFYLTTRFFWSAEQLFRLDALRFEAVSRPLVLEWMSSPSGPAHLRPRRSTLAGSPCSARSLQSADADPAPSRSAALVLYEPPTDPPKDIKWTRGIAACFQTTPPLHLPLVLLPFRGG